MARHNYHDKQEARREGLENAAERAERRSGQAFDQARRTLDPIPPGQPILVGHHSERRHRRALERADRATRRGLEEHERAAELRGRAAAVGSGGISSDDPEALEKLREKVGKLRADRENMKRLNAAWRKAGRPKVHLHGRTEGRYGDPLTEADAEKWQRFAELTDSGACALVRGLMGRDFMHRPPFTYSLSNMAGEIGRLEKRILALEALPPADAPVVEIARGVALGVPWVAEDRPDLGRVAIDLRSKPDRAVTHELRNLGFHWMRSEGVWTRALTNQSRGRVRAFALWCESLGGGGDQGTR